MQMSWYGCASCHVGTVLSFLNWVYCYVYQLASACLAV